MYRMRIATVPLLRVVVQSQRYCFRYIEEKIRGSSIYRKYNSALPQWLYDKPFVKHWFEGLNSASSNKWICETWCESKENLPSGKCKYKW